MDRHPSDHRSNEDELWGPAIEAADDRRRARRILLIVSVVLFVVLAGISYASMQGDEDHGDMPGMDMPGMDMGDE